MHIIGLRRAFPAASYLAYALEKMNISAMLHDRYIGQLDHRHALRAGDALIAISFAPYSAETVDLARHAHGAGIPVVALTDTHASPLAPLSAAVLTLQEVDFGAFRALSATLALAITLAVAVGAARG
ncbi:MAG: SIS domain-containing protein [Cypionkella sp.]|nr:SIS domain-containing protein [Cypionkella sp.]